MYRNLFLFFTNISILLEMYFYTYRNSRYKGFSYTMYKMKRMNHQTNEMYRNIIICPT